MSAPPNQGSTAQTGSRTQIETHPQSQQEQAPVPILHLRKHTKKPKVSWADDTVDNEHMNKKKTKICCIFHPADPNHSCESSSESESDASDDDGVAGGGAAGGPNAYEVQPKYPRASE
ncbi:hypothetical protein CANTEDRAFT_115109 [Yamadazyma tenuis ATCC 10573]|uniref:Type 1 phosphatases regulator n=1 Tax=Candida tenuis (strain ATCC 10573 / BCRC 21748 / CBS 615 / JCM 9827 / NBRC 10315 / NRRL Y-1498 / VKM Y-70) TaxID=590646 RepID=G3B7M6_CANTC|nr:uncharacterized protein CANTEDRAFT_115109 [Yamadazyma tenuis ATCC 10573]XP_006688768.1 uncharacterized protein CANTEDRAFT_115109 [Yamadazyma tenuis ATCC 10573]EGV62597.1 hypothetical protein CANTEDRAFT_115109 [Yamadazyma tenuis ATCC 10573]EGV62598.1 hypothetical protein CANTEDRAFT_115109 [Yamadazyma tenuis ATCC 10573]